MYPLKFKDTLRHLPRNLTLYVEGAPGIGKTEIAEQVAREQGDEFVTLNLLLCSPADLQLPRFNKDNDTIFFAVHDWWKRACQPGHKITIFLDEIRSALPSVQAAAQKLAFEREISGYRLNENARVIMAGNRKEDRAVVFNAPAPLRNRIIDITLEPFLEDWLKDYAVPRDVHGDVISFLQWRPELLYSFDPEKDEKGFATPRSWTFVSDILYAKFNDQSQLSELISGSIGNTASEFLAFLKSKKDLPSLEDIIKNPKKAKVPQDPELLYAVIGVLLNLVRAKPQKILSVLHYIKRMKKEFIVVFFKNVITNNTGSKRKLIEKYMLSSKVFTEEIEPILADLLLPDDEAENIHNEQFC